MRKIVVNVAMSLDGFIAGPNGEYDWCLTDSDYGMTAFLDSVDCVVMGRKSYEILTQYGPPYPEKRICVFSNTLKDSSFQNVVIVKGGVADYLGHLRGQAGKNIWIFGGSDIIQDLYEYDLVDEWMLSVHPVFLGTGIPLIRSDVRKNLQLAESITYPSGLVQCTYRKF